jgi:hypothetical protein
VNVPQRGPQVAKGDASAVPERRLMEPLAVQLYLSI